MKLPVYGVKSCFPKMARGRYLWGPHGPPPCPSRQRRRCPSVNCWLLRLVSLPLSLLFKISYEPFFRMKPLPLPPIPLIRFLLISLPSLSLRRKVPSVKPSPGLLREAHPSCCRWISRRFGRSPADFVTPSPRHHGCPPRRRLLPLAAPPMADGPRSLPGRRWPAAGVVRAA